MIFVPGDGQAPLCANASDDEIRYIHRNYIRHVQGYVNFIHIYFPLPQTSYN